MTLVEKIKNMTISELFELNKKQMEELEKETDMDKQVALVKEIGIVSNEISKSLGIL